MALGVGGHGRRERGVQRPSLRQVHFGERTAYHAFERKRIRSAEQELATFAGNGAHQRGMLQAVMEEIGAQGGQHLEARGGAIGEGLGRFE